MTKNTVGTSTSKDMRTKISAETFPRRTVEQTRRIPEALHSTYAGKNASWNDIASHLQIGPQSPNTKYLIWAAEAYGLITRTDEEISLAETGRKLVAPTYEGEDAEAKVKAILSPATLSKFYTDYNGHPVPSAQHFGNVLETKYGVPRDRVAEAIRIITENAEYAGVLIKGNDGEPPTINLPGTEFAKKPIAEAGDPKVINISAGNSLTDNWTETCFYITPIGDEGSEFRKHSDMMLKHLIEPSLKPFNLRVIRSDKIEKSGLITQQIVEHLVRARLCIADLSFSNPNVFYELAVRHMIKGPAIQVIRKGDRIPFDVSQGRTITVDTGDIYTIMDRFESARREMGEHIKSVLATDSSESLNDNPIDVYFPGIKVTVPKAA